MKRDIFQEIAGGPHKKNKTITDILHTNVSAGILGPRKAQFTPTTELENPAAAASAMKQELRGKHEHSI